MRRALITMAVMLIAVLRLLAFQVDSDDSGPQLLNIEELRALAGAGTAPPETQKKLDELLNTPFVHNKRSAGPRREPGSGLRVLFWNIERGLQWKLIRTALTDTDDFRRLIQANKPISDGRWRKAATELAELQRADILILNEVDLGTKRTGYADVSRELADATGMNYAFGVEFVEVDRLYTGGERIEMETPELSKALADDLRVDAHGFRGLHGNAVLSRFPIRSASIKRLSECYDWYGEEIRAISTLESGKRWAAKKVFAERIKRQVRRGGRMSLIVELEVDDIPQVLTVVSTHLEDRSKPSCRVQQMAEVAQQVTEVRGPVVIGGDLNSSTSDGTPTSFRYLIRQRVSDPRFWAKQGLQWFTPISIPAVISFPVNLWKNHHDPTAIHIPLIGRNRARKLFKDLQDFRFADGGRFDLTGGPTRSGNGRSRMLANSNERAWKGFQPTYHMERTFFIAGTYRLDWLLVKAGSSHDPLRPSNPKTLSHFNKLGNERLSDHHPISVELEFRDPMPPRQRR